MVRSGQAFTIAVGILGWGVVLGLPASGVLPEPEPTAALWIALFVFVRDRTARIEVGYGLEDVVTDARASRIVHEVLVPRLAAGDGEGAIQATVDAILVLVSDGSTAEPAKGPSELPVGRLVLYGIAALAFLILAITHPRLALQLLVVLASGHRRHGGCSPKDAHAVPAPPPTRRARRERRRATRAACSR